MRLYPVEAHPLPAPIYGASACAYMRDNRVVLFYSKSARNYLYFLKFSATAYYKPESSINLPTIPITPIGSIDALKYLEKMGGDEVQSSWRGGMNITYRYGPGFQSQYAKMCGFLLFILFLEE